MASVTPTEPSATNSVRGRMALLLVMTALCGAGFAALRPPGADRGLPEPRFWGTKLAWRGQGDLVLAGCSRVYCGLAPSEMAPVLGGARVLNYGFSLQAYSPAYLRSVPRPLDERSPRRAILLGIAPHNFLASIAETNQFLEFERRGRLSHAWDSRYGGLFDPYDFGVNRPGAGRWRFSVTYTADGWGALTRDPMDPDAALEPAREAYRNELPSYRLIDGLVDAARGWRRRGIALYALRMPLPKPVADLEYELTGFPFETVRSRLEDLGATWLEPDASGLQWADGAHLAAPSARIFSRRVALAIARAARP